MSKKIKLCLGVTLSIIVVFWSVMYNNYYKKTKIEIEEMNFETNYITEQIRQNTEDEEDEVSLQEEDIVLDFKSFPQGLLEQDQISFFLKLGEKNTVNLSGISMGSETLIGIIDETEIMQKELAFTYSIEGYSEFIKFFENVQSSEEYPSSIDTFTMVISEEDVVTGQMKINQYYIGTDDNTSNYEASMSVKIGTKKVFKNE